MYHLPGYNIERNDRKWEGTPGQIKKGGGVACFIKQNFTYTRENDDLNLSSVDLGSLWITILIPNMHKIVIGTVYRPPQGNIQNSLTQLENQIKDIQDRYNQPVDLFLLGDVNIDYINNRAMGRSGVRDIEEVYGMKQLITEPTHYGNKPTTLDYILTNSDCIQDCGVKHINISDHELVCVVRKKLKIQYNLINTFGRSYKNWLYASICLSQWEYSQMHRN